MAFQISAHGSREGVIRHVGAAAITPVATAGPVPPAVQAQMEAQSAQLEAVKSLLVSEINAIPIEFNGVRVDAQGDVHGGGRSIVITVVPQKMHL